MSKAPRGATTSTSLQLLLTGERLIARDGIEGVSLRQIAAESGSNNTSAVHYHFGTKAGLVQAIFAHRVPELVRRRELLLSRLNPHDLHDRLEAQLLPVLELAEDPDSTYLGFLMELHRSEEAAQLMSTASGEVKDSLELFLSDMKALLPDVPEPVRTNRILQAQKITLHAATERERSVASGEHVPPFGLFVSELLDGLAGYLTAPVSDETRRLLAGAKHGKNTTVPSLL